MLANRLKRFRSMSLIRITAMMGCLWLLLIVIVSSTLIFGERQRRLESAAADVTTETYFLADHASRLFEVSKVALSASLGFLGNDTWDEIGSSPALQQRLRDFANALPYVEDVWFNDEKGLLRITSFSYPTPYSNAADRDSFKAAQQPGDSLFVGNLIVGRVTNRPTFTISRRIEWPDHQFRGMATVTADLDYFADYWARLRLPLGERITIFRADNFNVLAQFPPGPSPLSSAAPAMVATNIKDALLNQHRETAGGTFGGERFGSYRQIGNLPLYISVDVDRADVDQQWRVWLWSRLPIVLLLVFSVGVVTLLALRQARIEDADKTAIEEARAELADINEQLRRQIGEREKAEQQNRQMQKMEAIGQLTGGLAHDFNNMLSIVIGNLTLMQRRMASGKDVTRHISNALEGAQRAATLTQRLLAFARQQPLAPEVIDANRFVADLSQLLRRTLTEAVQIETVLAGGLWKTRVDPSQLEAAVLNLAVNARDAMAASDTMAEGGRLTIETANASLSDDYRQRHPDIPAGQYVMIAVTDTGSGMPADVIARAFDPFFTTKTVGRGTGLGLSQVYGFVRQSGGHVKIYSEIGQGTTVKVYLPRHYGEAEAQPPVINGTERELAAQPGETILVVEDEADVRRVSVDALRDLGYQVEEAGGADEALAVLARRTDITLLFTDIVMPGKNGRHLADAARAENPALKVLFTTGYTRNAVVHNGMLDHGVRMLGKPFSVEQLARAIRDALDEA